MIVTARPLAAVELVDGDVYLLGDGQPEEPERERRLKCRAARLVECQLRRSRVQEICIRPIVVERLFRTEILRCEQQQTELESLGSRA